jgi:two-component system response regulator YesN
VYRVVIVEDEILVRVGLRNSIDWAALEMKVIAALANGAEAWDVYVKERPDIIITDIRMPVMDGMQLIAKIRKNDERTKIVILSCIEEFDMVRKAIQLGVMDYILKLTMSPDQMEAILLKVKEQLDQQQKHLPANPSINEQVWLENVMKDFMFRQLYSIEDFTALLKMTERQISHQKLMIIVVEVDHFHILRKRFQDDKGDLIKASLLNVLDEVLLMYNRGRVIHLEPWRYMIMLNLHDLYSEQKMQQIIAEMTDQIQKVMRTFFNVTVTFGASPIRSGFQHIKKQYEACMEVVALKYVLGGGRFFSKSDIRLDAINAIVEEQLGILLRDSAIFGHEGVHKQLAGKVQGYLGRDDRYDRNKLNVLFAQLLQLPIIYFAMSGESVDQIAFTAQNKLAHCESLEEAVKALTGAMKHLARQHVEDTAYSKAVSTAVEYIQRHYQQDLSLADIAAQVSMSPNYLGALFKKEVGLNIVDYMNRCKIDKSKELLETTTMKTFEIALEVGFSDHSYYSRVFRKEAGCNPKDYRKHLNASKLGDEEA